MRILISDTIDQLENENKLIQGNLNNITSLMDGMQQMVDTVWLEGRTYASMKEYYNYTVIPLTKALYFMLDDKTKANIQYENLLQSYFGGKIEYNREELMSQQKKIRMCREKIQRVSEVLRLCKGMCVVLYAMEIKLQEQIDLGEQFLAASSGIYDDVKELKAVFSKGLESMKEAICNDMGQCINIKAINKDWWTELDDIIQKKNWIHSIEEYRKYLEEHPEDREKIYKIIEFESMHPTDVKKINQFLSPLKEKTAIEIKYQAYMAREPYRSLWIKYLDRYKIFLSNTDSKSAFMSDKNGIRIKEALLEDDKQKFFSEFFHECGHAIDYNLRVNKQDGNSYFSSTYKYNDLWTLHECNRRDVENYFNKSINELYKDEAYREWSQYRKDKVKDEVIKHILFEVQRKLSKDEFLVNRSVVGTCNKYLKVEGGEIASDIFWAQTNETVKGGSGHNDNAKGERYWWKKDENTGKWVMIRTSNAECFAEYFDINMNNNQEEIEKTRNSMPESCACMNEMIKEME